jgi:RNA polymerase sigma-70 factor (ECF subfamily)
MVRYRQGDKRAFRLLFDRYAPRLRRTMLRGLFDREVADDLVQQTFLQLHRARNDFREGAAFRPWIYTIALNLKRSYFRKVGRRHEGDLAVEPAARIGDPEEQMAAHDMREVVATLPARQRQVVELFWFEGFSFPEIAEAIGSTHGAVKVCAHRAYKSLRSTLETRGVTEAGQLAYLGRLAL